MGSVRTNGTGARKHFGAYTDPPGSSDESLPRAGQANGSTSTGGRGSVVDVTAAMSHPRRSAAGTAAAPDDFRHAVATIRQHEADEYRHVSQDRHAKMAKAAVAVAPTPVSPKTVLTEEPECAMAALAITTPDSAPSVEEPSASPSSVTKHKSVSLPSTPRLPTPPPGSDPGYLFAPQHVPSRSLASSPALGVRPQQEHVRSVTPTMRRPAPLPPSTRRNGEPIAHRESPRASAAPSMASSVELDPTPAPHSDPPPQLTATGRRRPPSPPVARRKPPPPPTTSTHHRVLHPHPAEDGSPVDDVVVYNPFVARRSNARPPS